MHKTLIFLSLLTSILAFTQYPDCVGTPNTQPILDIPPKLIDTVTNGSKYLIKNADNTTALTIVVLKGSWYDVGYAYGQLLKEEINDAIPGMFNYLVSQPDSWTSLIEANLPYYLEWIPHLLSLNSSELLMAALGVTHQFTAPFTPERYTDELRGIADGSGINLTLLTYMNLLPEFIKAHCSMVGVWGPASYDSKLIQLRALDWDYQAYIVKFPLITVYFSEEEGSNPFANIGFAGLIGAISGFSTKVAISEKVWTPSPIDPKSMLGEPFPYILRDILQFGNDLESSMGILFNASRTCSIHVGIGSRADNSFEGISMNYQELDIYNDVNFTNYSDAHPQMDGIMYWDNKPTDNHCFGSIMQQNYGKIDPELIFGQVAPLDTTGDTQLIVYQFENSTIYVAYSDPENSIKAYTRSLYKIDMGELLTYDNIF